MADPANGAGLEELALLELLRVRLIRPQFVANPGAGAEVLAVAPGEAAWELLSVRLSFATSAVVANRHPALVVTDPDDKEVLRIDPQIVIAAAGAVNFNFRAGLGYSQAAEPTLIGLPSDPIVLLPGWKLKTATAALDVADAYTNVRLVVREWEVHRTIAQIQWLRDHWR